MFPHALLLQNTKVRVSCGCVCVCDMKKYAIMINLSFTHDKLLYICLTKQKTG